MNAPSVLEEGFQAQAMEPYNGSATRLTARDMECVDWLKSAIVEKNPAAFEIKPEEERAFSMSQPGLEYRDTLKSTATQALPVSVYPRFMIHLTELTPVIRAGATVVNTLTGEDLQVPRTTAYQTGNLIAEGQPITESDPTLGVVTLRSFGYKAFWQLSRELVEDSNTNLLDTLTQTAAKALATSYGVHLATGVGSQPIGYTVGGSVGVTGPTGTSTSFGTQGTAGQGTDLVFDLYGSIAEPYTLSPAIGVLARNATLTMFKKYREGSTNSPMLDMTPVKEGSSANLLGYPAYVDPNSPAMAANAKSVTFADWSRYFVRIAGGVRVERSDEFAFSSDLVSFKAVIRLDGQPIDNPAFKQFQHSAT